MILWEGYTKIKCVERGKWVDVDIFCLS
jgi:hypothetical protein